MAIGTPRALIDKLNPACRRGLELGIALCQSRTHFYVEIEHWLLKLLESNSIDLPFVLKQYGANEAKVRRELDHSLTTMKTGNGRPPGLSEEVIDLIRTGWLVGSLEFAAPRVRSAHLLLALLTAPALSRRLAGSSAELAKLPAERMGQELKALLPRLASEENEQEATAAATAGTAPPATGGGPVAGSKTPALDQFTVNLTDRAKGGHIDPVIGRDAEIRQLVNILTRRRQNNPILVGDAGVGKTAVVEGLALRVAAGDVPDPLKPVELRTLDLGLLQAGAGVKGEFENRLKNVMEEVKKSPHPIILFIDEAHTLIGAGGQQGQGDAANLLKPALARGELRTVAATTFAEYKKYFEADAALKRRFQPVRVDEPDEARAVRMLRGLVKMLAKHHKVDILDDAVVDTVRLSARYMPDRQLPDKAVSLLDTACARVGLSQSAVPPAVEDTRREIEHLSIEIEFLEREGRVSAGKPERLAELREALAAAKERQTKLAGQLAAEQKLLGTIRELRTAAAARDTGPSAELAAAEAELRALQGETPLVYPVVDGQAVAEVVSTMTGVPLGKMVRNEINTIRNLAAALGQRVVGQDHALDAIAQRIRTARADLGDPKRPQGVFLLVGPSGVGKTETALVLADLLYGGDRNMVVVNMSEYKESHKVSRLMGTSKGYVGYGEGGVLTNAVKARPHSVVLLDEVEKAHESVQEIFYQVFDKGVLQNDDGEDVNFKNTIILLTSNAGTDVLVQACLDRDTLPTPEELIQAAWPALLRTFKPALLGRMTVVPYYPLTDGVLKRIIRLKLGQIGNRLRQNYKAAFAYNDAVVDAVADRCTEVESGARNVDHLLSGTLLPAVADEILARLADGRPVKSVTVGVDEQSKFTYAIE